MERLQINLGKESYTINIEDGLRYRLKDTLKSTPEGLIITDEHVDELYAKEMYTELSRNFKIFKYVISAGETSKNLETVTNILNYMLDHNLSRNCTVIAFGGGVVGDIAGFCSSIYMRGVDYIQVPTTLLAQVDSSVGGKTGINMPQGKNLVGSFYQPKEVVIDTGVLNSLPEKEVMSGIGEVIKYGFIEDYDFFLYLKENLKALIQLDTKVLKYTIKKCCEIKGRIVSKDEKEKGLRKILNFGHTIGHALEVTTKYKTYTHGEAVLIGMYHEAKMALRLSLIDEEYFMEIADLMKGFNTSLEVTELEDLIGAMKGDKKNRDNRISFILPNGRGSVEEILLSSKEARELLSY
ncbi:3-dehydroquinate synthase [Alkaliphilus transvaalensis]|uniref:3-dehydroquinate synthase n=1 Tax=Alkaliphilus transvaalensis TaxID=114628 RepID=UPI000479EA43|nr:3-dehydroquinate synthase [Alkaliphilus transvaalensis]